MMKFFVFLLVILVGCELRTSVASEVVAAALGPDESESLSDTLAASITRIAAPLVWNQVQNESALHGRFSLRRRLEIGDFEELNNLFAGAVIRLPDTSTSASLLFTLDLDISNLRCTGISVGDILVTYNRESDRRLTFRLDIVDLDLTCYLDYRYKYGLISGSGQADAYTADNSASVGVAFVSSDFNSEPPTELEVTDCNTDINVVDLDFRGGFIGSILDTFERLIRGTVEGEVQNVACDELGKLGDNLAKDMLRVAESFINPYLEPLGSEYADFMFSENSLQVPETMDLLNFQESENELGSVFNMGLKAIGQFLGSQTYDETYGYDMGINKFLRDSLLDKDRAFVVNIVDLDFATDGVLYEGHDRLTQTKVTLDTVRVFGLDTFSRFDPLVSVGNFTLQNNFTWSYINVEVQLTVDIRPSTRPDSLFENPGAERVVEKIQLDFGVDDVDSTVSLLLAIDQTKLGNLTVGSLLTINNLVGCLLSSIVQAKFTGLQVDVRNVREPVLTGFVSKGVDRVVSQAVQALFIMYEAVLIEAIPNVFQTTIRDILNKDVIDTFLGDSENVDCPSIPSEGSSKGPSGARFVDLRDLLLPVTKSKDLGGQGDVPYGDLLPVMLDLVNQNVLSVDSNGTAAINDLLIVPITKSQSGAAGTLMYTGDLLDTGARIDIGGLQAKIRLKVYDAHVESLDSIGEPLSMFNPVTSPYILNNTASFGVDKPMRFGVTLLIAVENGDSINMKNEVQLSLDLSYLTLVIETLIMVAEERFINFPMRDFQNLHCWLAMIPAPPLDERGIREPGFNPTAALSDLYVSLSEMLLNVTCLSCSSPQLQELSALLATPEAVDDLNRVGGNILEYASQLLRGEFVQMQIDRLLNEAPRHCPHREEYEANPLPVQFADFETPDTSNEAIAFLVTLGIISACLVVLVMLIVFVVKLIVTRRNRKWVQTLSSEKIMFLHRLQSKERANLDALNRNTACLFRSKEIPLFVRYLIPLVILGNIGFFLSGHLSLGATVNIEAQLAGEKITIEEFFEFSMAKSTLDIWRAGGKELSILILIFSGIWPYTKQLTSLFLWFAPPTMTPVTKRGSILFWLDALAKWSMVDIFVLIVSIAAFRVSIQSPSVDFLPEGFYTVDLLVVPLWGLYANMIAQLISQVSSHFIIYYHRRVIKAALQQIEQHNVIRSIETAALTDEDGSASVDDSKVITKRVDNIDSLKDHAFARPHRGEKDRLIARSGTSFALGLSAFALVVLVIFGSILPSFSLDVLGLAGIAIESGQEFRDASKQHSVFTVIALLFEEARFLGTVKDYIGLGTLSIILILTVLVVPIVQAACLLRQWFVEMDNRRRWWLSVAIETLQAWQYVEVYLASIIVAAWQIGPVSEFMINDYCGGVRRTLSMLSFYGIIDAEDSQCFRVQAGIEDATFILAAGAVILAVMHSFVMKAVNQYERDCSEISVLLEETSKLPVLDSFTNEEVEAARRSITPPAVLFTDTFRWTLRREDARASRRTLHGLDDSAKLGVKSSFLKSARDGQFEIEADEDQLPSADSASMLTPDTESCGIPRMYTEMIDEEDPLASHDGSSAMSPDSDIPRLYNFEEDSNFASNEVANDGEEYAPNQYGMSMSFRAV